MVKNSHKTSRKQLWLLVLAAVILLLLVVAVLEKTGTINLFGSSAGDTSTNGPTPEEIAQEQNTNADSKQEYLDDTYKDKDDTPVVTPPADATVSITAKQEGSNVTVLTKIQSVAEGTCKLTVTNGEKAVTQEAAMIYQPEFSSCAGFGVPVSTLGAGTWNIKLTVSPPGGATISKSTTLEVQ